MTDHRLPVFAVILAGGSGTRFWPMARPAQPKQFLALFGGRSLFRLTCERVRPLVGPDNILVVSGTRHLPLVRRQAPWIPTSHILLEAIGRNTAAAIAIAASWVQARHADGIMAILPADHWVRPVATFRSALRLAISAARRTSLLVTLGIPPRRADTGFGYLRPAGRQILPGVRRVSAFVEKPDAKQAGLMIRSGRFLWNSGIFVWKATTILEEIRRHRSDVAAPLEAWARRAPGRRWTVPSSVLRRIPAIPIDKAVLEVSDKVLTVRGAFGWSDLGTWSAVAEVLRKDARGNAAIGRLVAIDSSDCLGVNQDGTTVFVGVQDVVAVRSGDALLVCHLAAAQKVREAADQAGDRMVGSRRESLA